jgi:P-type Ca2+ transporter type 2C
MSPMDPAANADAGRTMAFTTLALGELFHAFNLRSRFSLFKTGPFTNRALCGAFAVGALLQAAIALLPFTRELFGLYPLTPAMWAIAISLSFMPIVIMEAVKFAGSLRSKKK